MLTMGSCIDKIKGIYLMELKTGSCSGLSTGANHYLGDMKK